MRRASLVDMQGARLTATGVSYTLEVFQTTRGLRVRHAFLFDVQGSRLRRSAQTLRGFSGPSSSMSAPWSFVRRWPVSLGASVPLGALESIGFVTFEVGQSLLEPLSAVVTAPVRRRSVFLGASVLLGSLELNNCRLLGFV